MQNSVRKYKRTKLTGMFDSKFGFSAKVTPELLEQLNAVKEGGFIQLTRVKEETRERIASERGKDVENTVAAYLEFSEPDEEDSAPAATKKKSGAKLEKF